MRFSAFYFLSGAAFVVGITKTTTVEPTWAMMFLLSAVVTLLGAWFEAGDK